MIPGLLRAVFSAALVGAFGARPALWFLAAGMGALGYLLGAARRPVVPTSPSIGVSGPAPAHDLDAAQLTAIVSLMLDPVVIEGADRRVRLTNQAFCALVGFPGAPADLIGVDCAQAAEDSKGLFVDPDGFVAEVERTIAARAPVSGVLLRLRDGRVVERDYVPLFVDGVYQGHVWHYRDVTRRHRELDRVGEQAGFLATLLDRLPVMLSIHDAGGRVISVNRELVARLGWSREDWQRGEPLAACFRDDASRRAFTALGTDGTSEWITLPARSRTGDLLHTSWYGLMMPTGLTVRIGEDLTENARLHRDLESVIECLPDALFTVEPATGRLLRLNAAAEQLFGVSRREVEGLALGALVPAAQAAALDRLRADTLDSGREQVVELGLDLPAGPRVVRLKQVPIVDQAGVPLYLLALGEEISERQRTERELREAKEAAQQAAAVKSQFLANMSHEIRTPLNGVLGMSDVLRLTALAPDQRDCVETIHSAALALREIIDDILDFSKLEAEQVRLEDLVYAPADLVREVVALLGHARAARSVVVRAEVAAGLPGAVRGDPHRIRQVLTNLVGNAVKFTPHGEIVVALRVDQGRLVFSVTDTGIGIAPGLRELIFKPFVQADGSTTRLYGGTGLGLTICRQLVEAMGGTIAVDSTPGVGSRFWFEVPLVEASQGELAPARAPVVPATTVRRRILVAEDNAINQKVVRAMLAQLGHEVELVGNGREAIAAHEAGVHDVVLMDCQMPELSGLEATRAIRAGAIRPHVPIVAMSAQALPEDREACFVAGMDDHVAKPITRDELDAVLARVLAPPADDPDHAIDHAALTRLRAQTFDGETDLLPELVDGFCDELPRACAALARVLAAGDAGGLVREAHRLCSTTANLGATGMAGLCRELERIGRLGTLEPAPALLGRLRRAIGPVAVALRGFVAG